MYASPTGLASNSGLINSPMDLESAVSKFIYEDVDTIILLDGHYTMPRAFDFDISNRSILAETPFGVSIDTQDFFVTVKGDTGLIRGIVFESSTLGRETAESGSNPSDIAGGVVNLDADNSLIHLCVFRNLKTLFFSSAGVDSVLYGCHSYYHGWTAPDRGHGHAGYVQNITGTKTLKRNIFHDCFGWGIHAYSSNGANLQGFTFNGNICFSNGSLHNPFGYSDILFGADSVQVNGVTIRENRSYTPGQNKGLQFYGANAENVVLVDNYFSNEIVGNYDAIEESGNVEGVVGNTYFLEADEHDSAMAYLAIYNQASANTAQVDVSAIYVNGDIVNVVNAQDMFNDIQALTVTSGLITVNMQASNRTVEAPVGWPAPATSFPTFGAFILRKQS